MSGGKPGFMPAGQMLRPDRLDALLTWQLAIAAKQDPHHCSICGRHIGMWFYGFPFPLCCWCNDKRKLPTRLQCPPYPKETCNAGACAEAAAHRPEG
jgi:hypothetical protein